MLFLTVCERMKGSKYKTDRLLNVRKGVERIYVICDGFPTI